MISIYIYIHILKYINIYRNISILFVSNNDNNKNSLINIYILDKFWINIFEKYLYYNYNMYIY